MILTLETILKGIIYLCTSRFWALGTSFTKKLAVRIFQIFDVGLETWNFMRKHHGKFQFNKNVEPIPNFVTTVEEDHESD